MPVTKSKRSSVSKKTTTKRRVTGHIKRHKKKYAGLAGALAALSAGYAIRKHLKAKKSNKLLVASKKPTMFGRLLGFKSKRRYF